jgi:effector-binding domain-containing protein
MATTNFDCQEKSLPAMKVAALRMHAPYQKCGAGFSKLFKRFWFKSCGPAMLLCYDTEYKDVANYEVAVPVKGGESVDGIEVRELPAGQCIALLHKGPYDQLAPSYDKARAQVAAKGYKLSLPSREIYLKGCGMIFRGNPQNYLTEIQLMLEPQ